jgi:hypothetical protein
MQSPAQNEMHMHQHSITLVTDCLD